MDKEKMININASLVEEPVFSSFEKDGEEVKVANFTLVKKYGGGKEYTKCSVYGEKSEIVRDFKKGDLIQYALLRAGFKRDRATSFAVHPLVFFIYAPFLSLSWA